MPIEMAEIETLRSYLTAVMGRAEHHADQVDEVTLALIGAVVWRKDPDTKLEVLSRKGALTNVLWVTIAGTRYAFSYNHDQKTIELRRGSLTGITVASFSNSSTLAQVKAVFAGL